MKQKLFGTIETVKQIVGVVSPKKKLSGTLNAVRSRITPGKGLSSGCFIPTFCGVFGTAGTPVSYYKLIDKDGYTLLDRDGNIIMTKEGDDTLWQTQ